MRLVGYVFFLFLTLAPLYAKNPKGLFRSLDKLNARPLEPSLNQCSDDPKYLNLIGNESENLLQQCAVELCGKPEEAVSGNLSNYTFDDYVEEGVVKRFSEIENELTELIKNDIKKNNKFIADFRSNMQNGKFDFKFNDWDENNYINLTETLYSPNMKVEVDQTKELSKRMTITPIYPADASETFKKGLDSFIASRIETSLSTYDGFYYGIYSNEEAKVIIQNEWNKLTAILKDKEKELPLFFRDYQSKVDEIAAEVKDSIGEPYATANSLYSIKFLNSMITHELTGKYPEDIEPEKCVELCQLGIQEYLNKKDAVKIMADFEKANNSPDLIQEKLIICKTNLAMKGLKQSDTEGMMALFPEIKKRFLKLATKGYSQHSLSALTKFFDENINLSFKLPAEEAPVQSFIDGIHENFKEIGKETGESTETESPAQMVSKLIDLYPDGENIEPLASSKYCETTASFAIWDAFLDQSSAGRSEGEDIDPTKDNIMVSKFSCTHLGHGKDVLAHEMGHAMSFAFNEKKLSEESLKEFLKVRACANSHHRQPSLQAPYPDLTHPGDILTTEEDTADLVSYMAFHDDGLVFECALLETNPEQTRYTHLGLENPYASDPHSAPLFRALQEATHKGHTIPESCNKLIQENTKFGFEKCF